MPDPLLQSVSASQAAALVNQSPYATRWMLYQHFRDPVNVPLYTRPDKRMVWGRRLQSVILAACAEEFKLTVVENDGDDYMRRGVLGCTRDGVMFDPSLGPTVVEAKNVDRAEFLRNWTDTAAPPHIEIQTQVEMYAMDTQHAIIAVMVGGNELRFLRRQRDQQVIDQLLAEAEQFFADVAAGNEPPVSGELIEIESLTQLYAKRKPERVTDLSEDAELGDKLRQLEWWRGQRVMAEKTEEQLKLEILAAAKDATVLKAKGARARIRSTTVPPQRCKACANVVRAAGVRTTISVLVESGTAPNFVADLFKEATL